MAQQLNYAITWREEITYQDVTIIEQLAAASGFFRPDEVRLAAEFATRHLTQGQDSDYHFILAQQGGQTLAYACYGPIPGTLHSWSLYWIVVRQDARGQGLGSRLLTQVERRVAAAGGEQLYIETSSQPLYHPTRRFYQSRGYTLLTVLENFYARGDGKVIYAKSTTRAALVQAPAGGFKAARSAAILAR